MNKNTIRDNKVVGMYVKDQFISQSKDNEFKDNRVECLIENKNSNFE